MSKENLTRETESKISESCTDAIKVLHTTKHTLHISSVF